LAERGVDITDLTTRVVGEDAEPIYALMMEVAVPAGEDVDAVLEAVAADQSVDATVRPIEDEAL
jgi:hypothetical protein